MVEASPQAPPSSVASSSFCSSRPIPTISNNPDPSRRLFQFGRFHKPHLNPSPSLLKTPPLLPPDLASHTSWHPSPPKKPATENTAGDDDIAENDDDSLLRRFSALAEGILSVWDGEDSIRARVERLARRQQALDDDISMIEVARIELQRRVERLEDQEEEFAAKLEKIAEERMRTLSEIRATRLKSGAIDMQKDYHGHNRSYGYDPGGMMEGKDGWENKIVSNIPGRSYGCDARSSFRIEGSGDDCWKSSTRPQNQRLVSGVRSVRVGESESQCDRTIGSNAGTIASAEPQIQMAHRPVTAARKLSFSPCKSSPNRYASKAVAVPQHPKATDSSTTVRLSGSNPRNSVQESQMVAFEMLEFVHRKLTGHLLSYMWRKVQSMESEKERGDYLEIFRGGDGTPFAGKPLNEAAYAELLSFANMGRIMEEEEEEEQEEADEEGESEGKGRQKKGRKEIVEAMEAAETGLVEEARRQGYSTRKMGEVRRQMGVYVRCHRQMKHMAGMQRRWVRREGAEAFTEGSVSEAVGAAMAGSLGALQGAKGLVKLAAFFLTNKNNNNNNKQQQQLF